MSANLFKFLEIAVMESGSGFEIAVLLSAKASTLPVS
jgi:hypothetical protein